MNFKEDIPRYCSKTYDSVNLYKIKKIVNSKFPIDNIIINFINKEQRIIINK